jgi:hypothetical protein
MTTARMAEIMSPLPPAKKTFASWLDWLTSDHRLLTSSPFVADDTFYGFFRF